MDTQGLTDTVLTALLQYGIVAVMYVLILQYRLPYMHVLLAYAGLSLLPRIYNNTLGPAVRKGDRASQPHFTLGSAGLVLLLLVVIPAFAVPGIALYRFSALEAVGLFAAGWAASMVAGVVAGRI